MDTFKMTPLEADMRARLRPTAEQLEAAVAQGGGYVALVLPGKTRGVWTAGQAVEPAARAVWRGDHHELVTVWQDEHGIGGREHAIAAADLQLSPRRGTVAFVRVYADGEWVVFEA